MARTKVIRTCMEIFPGGERLQGKARGALAKNFKWKPGSVISVSFLDGDPKLWIRIENVAHTWEKYANLKFVFQKNNPKALIRISFKGKGSWSCIGTGCKSISAGHPTMNFGWLTLSSSDVEVRRVVLHEFGHAIGLIHEHQNPAGGIEWNKPIVYKYYMGPPNNWSKKDIDTNLFQPYNKNVTQYSKLDPTSIMIYPIPKEFTLNGFSAGSNTTLSAVDKSFIAKVYPLKP